MAAETMVRWFWWNSMSTDNFEQWLEDHAARGWHLVKTDRLMLRCHFRRGEPKKVRYCVDYPAEVTDEYYAIFHDAGWEHVSTAFGWYIWRTEYSGERRPELFNDVEPLIERNNRLLLVFGLSLVSQIGIFVTDAINWLVGTTIGRIILVPYCIVLLAIAVSAVSTYRHNVQLKSRRR